MKTKTTKKQTPIHHPRYPGRTYVMMREGDPWHACHVSILPGCKAFKIEPNAEDFFDCVLLKRWHHVASGQQTETRPVRRSELW